jgi:hypothetical protein
MTPEQARAFIRKVMGPPSRQLEGQERADILLILSLKESISSSNNQHAWTDVYIHNGKEYHVTSFANCESYVVEILPEDQ